MAPSTDETMDHFAILGVSPLASDAEIRKAHKKLSLALHPDKNRHLDPQVAAARFSEMQLAYEVLMDPEARLAAAERIKVHQQQRQRQDAFDGKRKAQMEDLQRREEEDRLKRSQVRSDATRRAETLQQLREEGQRLRQEREQQLQDQVERIRGQKPEQDRPMRNRSASPPSRTSKGTSTSSASGASVHDKPRTSKPVESVVLRRMREAAAKRRAEQAASETKERSE